MRNNREAATNQQTSTVREILDPITATSLPSGNPARAC